MQRGIYAAGPVWTGSAVRLPAKIVQKFAGVQFQIFEARIDANPFCLNIRTGDLERKPYLNIVQEEIFNEL